MGLIALTKEEERRHKMVALIPRTHGPDIADKYRAIAEWWRLQAEESRDPDICFQYAENQDRIALDMESRPAHHAHKPADLTRYQWSLK